MDCCCYLYMCADAADCSKLMSRCSAARRVSRVIPAGPLGTGCKTLELQLQLQQQERERQAAGQRVMLRRYMQVRCRRLLASATVATKMMSASCTSGLLLDCTGHETRWYDGILVQLVD
jgi:hypothetical protein